jgi:IstB-like ATP binding protein
MTIDHSTFDVDPSEDRDGFLIARNVSVTAARLARIADGYTEATTDNPQIAQWVSLWRDHPGSTPWLYLFGTVGTGKTWAVIAALREAVKVPRTVVWEFVTFSALLESRRPKPDQVDSCRYERCDLLVIDDLSMVKSNSEWAIEELWRVIDYRRRNDLTTILTGNLPPANLSAEFNEQIMSRIAQACIVVSMVGDDRRRTGPPRSRPTPMPTPPPDPTVRDRRPEVKALLAQLRAEIPAGDPDKLRYATKHWSRVKRHRERTDDQPNPLYRPTRPMDGES